MVKDFYWYLFNFDVYVYYMINYGLVWCYLLFLFLLFTMKKKLFIIIWVVLLGVIVFFITKSDTKSAGWYLDRQIELENQIKTLKIEWEEVKTKKEKLYVENINKGLLLEQEQPQRTWTEAEILTNQFIE